MKIHVVQPGETIFTIADKYGVSATRLIQDNDIHNSDSLVTGQTIVILFPDQIYTVQPGDSLSSIARLYDIPVSQLIRNNSYLLDRNYIYPGETMVISYLNDKGDIKTNGYVNTYVDKQVLEKALPFLTYVSVYGYRTTNEAEIIDIDDSNIIQTAKNYGVAPLMFISAFTLQGLSEIDAIINLLLNDKLTDKHVSNILKLLTQKGYYGLNITFQFINNNTLSLYEKYARKLYQNLHDNGFKLFISFSAVVTKNDSIDPKIDYSKISQYSDGFTFMNYSWSLNYGAPLPVTSISNLQDFVNFAITQITPDKIDIGCPILGYDWALPYTAGSTKAAYLKVDDAIELAKSNGATILFDDASKTPYFNYYEINYGVQIQHIVWFIDARTIDYLTQMVSEYILNGTGVWNTMYFYSQLWIIINSQYKILKLFPEP